VPAIAAAAAAAAMQRAKGLWAPILGPIKM